MYVQCTCARCALTERDLDWTEDMLEPPGDRLGTGLFPRRRLADILRLPVRMLLRLNKHTHITHHILHITHHTLYITHHTSHATHHTSHITYYTSHTTHTYLRTCTCTCNASHDTQFQTCHYTYVHVHVHVHCSVLPRESIGQGIERGWSFCLHVRTCTCTSEYATLSTVSMYMYMYA